MSVYPLNGCLSYEWESILNYQLITLTASLQFSTYEDDYVTLLLRTYGLLWCDSHNLMVLPEDETLKKDVLKSAKRRLDVGDASQARGKLKMFLAVFNSF